MSPEKDTPNEFLGLKAKRETLRLTLQDISGLTRISLVNLEAIENGAFCHLPAPIYSKNFIKSYARVLNLDSKPILDSYEAYLTSLQTIQTPMPEMEPPPEPLIRRIAPYKVSIAAASIIIAVIVVILIVFQRQEPMPSVAVPPPSIIPAVPQPAVSTPENPAQQAVQAKTVAKPVLEKNNPPPPPQQKIAAAVNIPPRQDLQLVEKKAAGVISAGTDLLVIRATEEAWLRIRIDQNPPFQVLLKPGEEIKRTGTGFELDIGNAGGITVQFKGKTIENLGKSGEVIHLQLP